MRNRDTASAGIPAVAANKLQAINICFMWAATIEKSNNVTAIRATFIVASWPLPMQGVLINFLHHPLQTTQWVVHFTDRGRIERRVLHFTRNVSSRKLNRPRAFFPDQPQHDPGRSTQHDCHARRHPEDHLQQKQHASQVLAHRDSLFPGVAEFIGQEQQRQRQHRERRCEQMRCQSSPH
jgi:hypothetical protein